MFRSTIQGANWTSIDSNLTNFTIHSLAVSNSSIFAATSGGVFLSTNDGTIWRAADSGLTNTDVNSLVVNGNNLFAGTYGGGIFLSTNNGAVWTGVNTGLTNSNIFSLFASGTDLFAGTYGGGVFHSTNNGASWAASGLTDTYVYSFVVSGTNLFAGGEAGVFLSTDNGTNWKNVGDGLTNDHLGSLAINDNILFAGTYSAGVWWRPLSEMVMGIEEKPTIASSFLLYQNYPNPFNPTTSISYQLPMISHVSLKVYDVLGKEIKTLVNERQNAGIHNLTFNGSNLPTGIYFYRLQAGNYTQTKKLILLK